MATHTKRHKQDQPHREMLVKEDGQEYATVIKLVGEGRLVAKCGDGVERLCHIRGTLKKKVWIIQGDTILIGLRDFQDGKADVIAKYSDQEVRMLRSMGEIQSTEKQSETELDVTEVQNDSGFDFASI
jgi:translation initiation factor 1A